MRIYNKTHLKDRYDRKCDLNRSMIDNRLSGRATNKYMIYISR